MIAIEIVIRINRTLIYRHVPFFHYAEWIVIAIPIGGGKSLFEYDRIT